MGFAITWCAVREDKAQGLLDQLGLSPTGERERVPESLISMATLDTGWRVIWYNEYACPLLKQDDLRKISEERDILVCLVEEHVMASSSEFWSGGSRAWWIAHEGEDGPIGLETDGEPPDVFPAIKKAMEDAQRAEGRTNTDVDYIFEIPLKVAQAIVGFKHDEECPHLTDEKFVVMSRPASRKGLLNKLWGG